MTDVPRPVCSPDRRTAGGAATHGFERRGLDGGQPHRRYPRLRSRHRPGSSAGGSWGVRPSPLSFRRRASASRSTRCGRWLPVPPGTSTPVARAPPATARTRGRPCAESNRRHRSACRRPPSSARSSLQPAVPGRLGPDAERVYPGTPSPSLSRAGLGHEGMRDTWLRPRGHSALQRPGRRDAGFERSAIDRPPQGVRTPCGLRRLGHSTTRNRFPDGSTTASRRRPTRRAGYCERFQVASNVFGGHGEPHHEAQRNEDHRAYHAGDHRALAGGGAEDHQRPQQPERHENEVCPGGCPGTDFRHLCRRGPFPPSVTSEPRSRPRPAPAAPRRRAGRRGAPGRRGRSGGARRRSRTTPAPGRRR